MTLTPVTAADYLDAIAAATVEGGPVIGHVDAGLAAQVEAMGRGYTGRLDDGTLCACAGIVVPWPGLGMAWAVVSPVGTRHPVGVHRAVLWGLHYLARDMGLRRVETTVRADFPRGRRWAQALGFQEESLMPKYGADGSDHLRYVYFPKEIV